MPSQFRLTEEMSTTAAGIGISCSVLPTYWLTKEAFDGIGALKGILGFKMLLVIV
jgi:hypothetical protein